MEAKGGKNYIYIPSNWKWIDGSAGEKVDWSNFHP